MAGFPIRKGPSKLDLMLALFDGEDAADPRSVHLVLWDEETLMTFEREMRINLVRRERHNQRFYIEGALAYGPLCGSMITNWKQPLYVRGYYSVKDRSGHLEHTT